MRASALKCAYTCTTARISAIFENLTLSIYERKLDAPFLPVQGGNALTAALQAAAEVSRGVQLTRMS